MVTTILKPTRDCNLGCKYCYTEVRNTNEKISYETVYTFFKKLKKFEIQNNKEKISSHIIWHGGEPLLMGKEFYKNIVDMQKDFTTPKFKFANSIQTNGTLLDKEWVEWFHKNDFGIGLSLDGPKQLNDQTRVYKDGSSAYNEILNGVELVKEVTGHSGIIVVVSSKNVNNLEEIADFCKERNYSLKLNPLIPSGVALEHEDLSIKPTQYGKTMSQLFRKWFEKNDDYVKIDTFTDIIKSFIEAKPYGCNYNQTCQDTFISLAPNGDVYPCGRFDGLSEYKLGNINNHKIEDIMDNPIRTILQKRHKHLDSSCGSCNIGDICNGGCMHNAYLDGNIMNKDPLCVSNKMLFGTIAKEITDYVKKVEEV